MTSEPITGAEILYPDGTKVVGGKVVKKGPRVILNEKGKVIGIIPDNSSSRGS